MPNEALGTDYRPLVAQFSSSGSGETLRLESLDPCAPTLGASAIAQVRDQFQADLVGRSRMLVSFVGNPDLERALMPVPVAVLLPERSFNPFEEAPPWWPTELLRDARRLRSALEGESVEDGMSHPAEFVLEELLQRYGADALVNLILGTARPAMAAEMIRLLARTEPPQSATIRRLVEEGLRRESVELRDAVAQAVELWEDTEAAAVLSKHQEPIAWLADYMDRVVKDLRG